MIARYWLRDVLSSSLTFVPDRPVAFDRAGAHAGESVGTLAVGHVLLPAVL
jgi:hypothetical protein